MDPITRAALRRELRSLTHFRVNAQRHLARHPADEQTDTWESEVWCRKSQILTLRRVWCALERPGAHVEHGR